MHDTVKKFHVGGTTSASDDPVKHKENLVHFMTTSMREKGYVPVYDLDPQYTRSYDAETQEFNFGLTCYGVWVGKENSWQIAGILNGKRIPTSIPQDK